MVLKYIGQRPIGTTDVKRLLQIMLHTNHASWRKRASGYMQLAGLECMIHKNGTARFRAEFEPVRTPFVYMRDVRGGIKAHRLYQSADFDAAFPRNDWSVVYRQRKG